MSDREPEVVRRLSSYDVTRLDTAITVIQTRDPALARILKAERDVLRDHRNQLDAFATRMKFGSAAPWHPEGVMDWLIAQGWAPPKGLLMAEGEQEGQVDR
ncbi:hypothetical protein ACI7YT_12375 [Microbacterium sp. M]|uniref:hypothetical protein n=1 Tax=Microbacterium sp. M TaxID=3377125 RepID=UPI00386988F0